MQMQNNESSKPDLAANESEPSAFQLVLMLLAGFISAGVSAIPERVRHGCISTCGMVVLFAPLMLWISWSKVVFYLVLSSGSCAVLIIWLLVRFAPEDYF